MILLKPFQWLYSIYAFILFVGIMLLIFPFALIASFFGRIRGGNIIYRLCMLWADLWFPLVLIYAKRIYASTHNHSKPYIFVSNHSSYLDAAIIVKAFRQPLRPLGKVEMARVPIFGFIYKKAIVTVDRSSAVNRAKSVRILKSILSKGISILVFPEGTFSAIPITLGDFYDGAFRVSIETQTAIKPVLFLDASKRLHPRSILSLTPGKCRIYYMDEISVEGLTLHDIPLLREKTHALMKEKLIQLNGPQKIIAQ